MDKDAINLTKAIAQQEGNNPTNYSGDGGTSAGAYQWQNYGADGKTPTVMKPGDIPTNFKSMATEAGLNPNDFSGYNQDMVAYSRVKKLKDAGKSVDQISSLWNSGNENSWKPGTVQAHGNTPQYADNVYNNYQKLKGGQTQPSVSQETPTPDNKDLLQKTGDVVNSIFPGKEIGQDIGTLGGLAYEKLKGLFGGQDNSKYYDTSAPTPLQAVGDVAQGALMTAPGLGEVSAFGKTIPALSEATSALGRIGQTGLLGAGLGATGAIAGGSTNLGDIAKQGLIGGALGGALGGVGETISAVASHFPTSMIQGKYENLTDAEAQKFLNQKIGTQSSLLNQAQNVVATEGNKIDTTLQSPKYANYIPTTNPFSEVLQQFPEYQGKEGQLVAKIKTFISSNGQNMGTDRSTLLGYVDKIVNGDANLFEQNQVRKVIDAATKGGYAKMAKAINPSAGHDLAMTFADALRNEVKTTAPETIPMFSELQKSVNIRNAVNKVANKKGSNSIFRYSDIIPFLGGNMVAPGAGVGAVLANRALENPATRFAGAKISQGLLGGTSTIVKSPLTIKNMQGLFGGNVNVR
jgi:hypothetical protein